MDDTGRQQKPIHRVGLACIQCRSRHVKCDAIQPACGRCTQEGKDCTYQKSRRGGLDKAALARRREKLQQQALEDAQTNGSPSQTPESLSNDIAGGANPGGVNPILSAPNTTLAMDANLTSSQLGFQVNTERLLDIYYENYWAAYPLPLPAHHLNQRRLNNNHGMENLLLVLQYVGSIFAPWTKPEPYYEAAEQALGSQHLFRTPFNVQALMILAIAQLHTGRTRESRRSLDTATSIAIDLCMNTQEFAVAYGEGNPVLEESWRRTYYLLALTDQHFSVIANNPMYALMNVPNLVDLPCDDEFYESGVSKLYGQST